MKHKQVLIRLAIALLLSQAVFVSGQGSVAVDDPTKLSKISLSEPLTIGWRYDTPATLNLTPAFDDERVYLPLAEGVVVSLQGATGQLNWRAEMGGELSASPVADNHMVFVASETGKPEAGVRRATGAAC